MATVLSTTCSAAMDTGQGEKPNCVVALVQAARELAPTIDAAREAIERDRGLPPVLVDAMGAAGMFSLWLPKSLGGPELNAADFVRVIEERCLGWTVPSYGVHRWLLPTVAWLAIWSPMSPGGSTAEAERSSPAPLDGAARHPSLMAAIGSRVIRRMAAGFARAHGRWAIASCTIPAARGNGLDGALETRLVMFPTQRRRSDRYLARERPSRHGQSRSPCRRSCSFPGDPHYPVPCSACGTEWFALCGAADIRVGRPPSCGSATDRTCGDRCGYRVGNGEDPAWITDPVARQANHPGRRGARRSPFGCGPFMSPRDD